MESFDFVSLHAPYNKLVQKGFARLAFAPRGQPTSPLCMMLNYLECCFYSDGINRCVHFFFSLRGALLLILISVLLYAFIIIFASLC